MLKPHHKNIFKIHKYVILCEGFLSENLNKNFNSIFSAVLKGYLMAHFM